MTITYNFLLHMLL